MKKSIEEMTVKEYINYLKKSPLPKCSQTLESLYKIFDDVKDKYIFHALSPSQCPPNSVEIHTETKDGLLYRVRKCKNIKDTYLVCVSRDDMSKYIYYTIKTKSQDYSLLVEKLFNVNGKLLKTIL